MLGAATKKQDMQPMQVPRFTGFLTNTFFALKSEDTKTVVPLTLLSLSQNYNTLSHSSLVPSSPIYILIHCVTFYGDRVHIFLFYPLHNLILPEKNHSNTAGSVISDETLHLLYSWGPLSVSLVFKFMHFIAV